MTYVEFPFDRIVSVRWGKKHDDSPPVPPVILHQTCGAWTRDLFYAESQNHGVQGFKYWIPYQGTVPTPVYLGAVPYMVYGGSLFGQSLSNEPPLSQTPGAYWPVCKESYLWANPSGGWDVTVDRGATGVRYEIGVWRGFSIHDLLVYDRTHYYMEPTYWGPESEGIIRAHIPIFDELDHRQPPIFALFANQRRFIVDHWIPDMVQALCCFNNQTGAVAPGPCAEQTDGAPPYYKGYYEDAPPPPPFNTAPYLLSVPSPVPESDHAPAKS